MKKILLPLMLLALAVACGPKHTPAGDTSPKASDIVILYDNDVHCSVDGYANMAALKAEMLTRTPYVTLVSNGDFVQGGSLGAASKGGYIVEIMNAAGYDIVIPGNHEFDFAIPRLMELTSALNATTLCCNLIDLRADKRLFAPYKIIDYGGTKVAFIGVATPYSFNSSTPAYFQDDKGNYVYSLCAENFYDNVQNFVNDARSQGADYVVAMTHLGDDVEYDPINSQSLAWKTEGIDVIIDGHSHSLVPERELVNKAGRKVLYSQTGAHFENLGVLKIRPGKGCTVGLIPVKDYPNKDPKVEKVIAEKKSDYAKIGGRRIGASEVMLPAKNSDGDWLVRKYETSLGDFCADAFRFTLGTDIALVGGGSLRKDLPSGDIKFDDIFNVFPFSNMVCKAELTGKQILDVLEFSVGAWPADFGGFLQVSGLTFEFDPSIESPVVYDINKAFVRIDAGERRVFNVRILNKDTGIYEPIDHEKTYTVGGTAYLLRDAGDGYEMLNGVGYNLGIPDVNLLEKYIVEFLKGEILTSQYGQDADRIIRK